MSLWDWHFGRSKTITNHEFVTKTTLDFSFLKQNPWYSLLF